MASCPVPGPLGGFEGGLSDTVVLLASLGDSAEALLDALADLGFSHGRAFRQDEPDPAPERLVPLADCLARARELVAHCRSRGEFNLVLARRPFSR